MNTYNVVNYHVTNLCNYHCAYCFGKFDRKDEPTFDEAKKVVDNVAEYFKACRITDGRINFAGGEPTLYRNLDELIEYTHSKGIAVSIVTNGSLLTDDRVRLWQGKVSCVGVSIDSATALTNCMIGRCHAKGAMVFDDYIKIATALRKYSIDLKINTVVSKLNYHENLCHLYRELRPKKIKLLQMHLVEGINDRAKEYQIAKKEFDKFCRRHSEFESIIVEEPCESMENSYLMINPDGELQINDNGVYKIYGKLSERSLCELLTSVPLDSEKFNSRYGKGGLI